MTDFDVRRTEGAGAGTGAGESLFVSLCVRTSRFSLSFYFMHYLTSPPSRSSVPAVRA
jgi:hypothetical protein